MIRSGDGDLVALLVVPVGGGVVQPVGGGGDVAVAVVGGGVDRGDRRTARRGVARQCLRYLPACRRRSRRW